MVIAGCTALSTETPAASTQAKVDPAACNGEQAWCDRGYDELAYATAHNAMASEAGGFLWPNQRQTIERQLTDGVRALMLDTHQYTLRVGDQRPWLCHRFCWLGGQPLVEGLTSIRQFLDRHPREVVTLLLENHADTETVAQAFEQAGLDRLAHVQPPDRPWPTLGDMVAADHRLVVFTDRGGGERPWLHSEFQFAFENPWQAAESEDFSCVVHRGSGRGLFVLNHFLSRPLPDREAARVVNRALSLRSHVARCERERGRRPNFVTVDHYDVGDVLAVVEALNRAGGT